MMHTKSDSDVSSLAPSSPPRSPKRPVYYVQSPSRDSHDGDKLSSMQATPVYNSPMESPSHPSFGRHSRASSASRFSGTLRSSSGRKGNQKRVNDKGWPECDVIQEEGSYDDLDEDKGLSRRCQIILGLLSFVLLFTVFCLIIWGAARPYRAEVVVKSLSMDDFYAGEGSDSTGVPTKMVTVNCSLKINVYNPATMFGIHVTSGPINLIYSEITIATGQTKHAPYSPDKTVICICGKLELACLNNPFYSFTRATSLHEIMLQLKKYYQPRKSHRTVSVILHGEKVPLYGAGAGLALSSTGGAVPLTLDLEIISRGYVVGKLVKVKHRKHVSCPVVVDSRKTKPIKFKQNSCTYV